MTVAVAGHTCLDIIPDWNRGGIESIVPGHILEMDGIKLSTGGTVPNTGLALEKLGIRARLFGKIGDDPLGEITRGLLRKKDERMVENLIVGRGETSSYTIVLSPPDTDRVFLHSPGTNNTYTAEDIPCPSLEGCELFHFGYPPLMRSFFARGGIELVKMFSRVREAGLITSLDLAMPDPDSESGRADWKAILSRTLPHVDIFLPSLEELFFMVDARGYRRFFEEGAEPQPSLLNRLAERALDWGAGIVVLKLGSRGIYLQTGDLEEGSSPALLERLVVEEWSNRRLFTTPFIVEAAGTTGAGDSAIAGFLSRILKGAPPEDGLTLAAATGACSVEEVDATGGIRPLNEVLERIREGWDQREPALDLSGWETDGCGVWKPS